MMIAKRHTPDDADVANEMIAQPSFWCRARLFRALSAARASGVLKQVMEEMRLPDDMQDLLVTHLQLYWETINIGDRVRSYDFPFRKDCYIEGEVKAFRHIEGCERYVIRADTRVWGAGEEEKITPPAHFYPPVNGTPTLFGGVCAGVEKVMRVRKPGSES